MPAGENPLAERMLTVDGHEILVSPGTSVLEAARMAGVNIPTLCHHPALPADGSCRLCLVAVDGRHGLHAACVLPATNGLVVNTETQEIQAERRNVLRLLLGRYRPGKGGGDNELLMLAARYGIPIPARPWADAPDVDTSNPFIVVDRGACIHCWRCVRACDLLNGVAAIGVFGRGVDAQIGFGLGGPMQASTCEFCGMCEAVCPTDALTVAGAPPLDPATSTVSTVCSYCGVGCRLEPARRRAAVSCPRAPTGRRRPITVCSASRAGSAGPMSIILTGSADLSSVGPSWTEAGRIWSRRTGTRPSTW